MKTTFRTGRAGPGQGHLGDDLGAAELAQQAVPAGHAEHAAHRAAHLGGDAQAVPGQQHALHRLAVGQFHQQARGAVLAGVLGAQARQPRQFRGQGRQLGAERRGEEILGPVASPVVRQGLGP
jgi:hypothetical protein